MLGVAIWMLEKVLPSSITTLMYGLIGIGFALYLGVFTNEGHIFKRSVAFVVFVYSLAIYIGFLAGEPSLRKPLGFLQSDVRTTTLLHGNKLNFIKVTSLDELNAVLQKNRGKKIMLDFSAEWCSACKELEEVTFADSKVKEKLREFVLIRADVTANGHKEKALAKAYGVFGPPVIIFFDKDLHVRKSKTIVGFLPPQEFLWHLNSL